MIYLDNSATTALCPAAKAAMLDAIEHFGNPSSLHDWGLDAEHRMEKARKEIFDALGLHGGKGYRLVFTSGGTEGNNLALFGVARAKKYRFRPRILLTDSEHPCIIEPAKQLEKEGFEVLYLSTKGGKIDKEELREKLNERTILLSVMSVNNETGADYEVGKLFRMAKAVCPEIICHTDAVQAFLKTELSIVRDGCDLVTLSAHKIHGPKGAGALLIKESLLRAKKIVPVLLGGGQEDGMRSGTENMPGICGFGAAAKAGAASFAEDREKMRELRDYLLSNLPTGYRANLPPLSAPHILSVTSPRIKSETLLHFLSSRCIFVSSGSACSSHGKHGSYVLGGFGLSDQEADCTIRVSLTAENTREDADALLAALADAANNLISIR